MMRKKMNKSLIGLFCLSIILLGNCVSSHGLMEISTGTTYELKISKGMTSLQVKSYDETKWKATVSSTSLPNSSFDGDANIVNARNKVIINAWFDNGTTAWEGFTQFILPYTTVMALSIFGTKAGGNLIKFNESVVNGNYTSQPLSWEVTANEWYYNNTEFYETSNNPMKVFPIFKTPSNYKILMDDYNNWSNTMNKDPGFAFTGLPALPNYTADEFLWLMIERGMIIASPNKQYLTGLTSGLGCSTNVVVSETGLSITKTGIASYVVEVTFKEDGIISSFVFKDLSGNILYNLELDNSNLVIIYIMIGVGLGIFILPIILQIRSKKKRK